MNVLYELRCPKCRGFISGYEKPPEGAVRGYCRKCSRSFDALAVEKGLDIAAIRIRTFA